MQHTTPKEEDLILNLATHPKLDSRCWKMIAKADNIGGALKHALATVFPAETRICHDAALRNGRTFWSIAAIFVESNIFCSKPQQAMSGVQALPPSPAPRTSSERTKNSPLHPVLGHPWWDEDTTFHEPTPVDNYLLMSHTS